MDGTVHDGFIVRGSGNKPFCRLKFEAKKTMTICVNYYCVVIHTLHWASCGLKGEGTQQNLLFGTV
jgi:hypothetical protein